MEKIYDLQKVLIEPYIKIEGLPPYPVDVNTKASQTLLKDFTGRVTEELAEGYEAFKEVLKLTKKNQYWFNDFDREAYKMALNHLQNANEEQADALHFMIELLIYANIQPEDIRNYLDNKFTPVKEFVKNSYDIIRYSMVVGSYILQSENNFALADTKNMIDLLKPFEDSHIDMDVRYLQGGRLVNDQVYQNQKLIMHDITYHLNIARNFLKNKPWKQSQVMTNETAYQEQLVLTFIKMMGYFNYLGLTSEQVYFLYFKKNLINRFRQASLY